MRIQSVVLEYHRDISVLWLHVVYNLVADLQFARGDLLQTCDHTKRCGFSASGRAYKDDEFFVFDLEVKILNCFKAVRINLADVL